MPLLLDDRPERNAQNGAAKREVNLARKFSAERAEAGGVLDHLPLSSYDSYERGFNNDSKGNLRQSKVHISPEAAEVSTGLRCLQPQNIAFRVLRELHLSGNTANGCARTYASLTPCDPGTAFRLPESEDATQCLTRLKQRLWEVSSKC